MINKIISFSIKNKFIVGLLTLALVGVGVYSMSTVNLGSVPDITNNQVQVLTVSPNLATEDIEQFVTYPVELAMGNLPGVEEIRSISRFGLSVVTIVFEDDLGTYLPRQLVQEKLNELQETIPLKFGSPTMGPISTGLGQIYEYTIRPKQGSEKVYTPTELRTIQDWIVKRQLTLLDGVVEVNSFGGYIKQYEVAISPDKLNAQDVSISEVYEALARNNTNTGGAYIEKNRMSNFIRGEGLIRSLDDIRKIVVKTESGIPVTIGDIASKVHFGQQVRYGAFTQDGEEAVGGIIMMLKGSNPNAVIQNVKERMEEVEKSLPEGLEINAIIDRSDLISRTTSTVKTNLIEGALIVIFALVILLGSLRGGIITATTIPLSLLFAFILMKQFNIWANLMSLGAIDFGIIIDGAVIIIEGTVYEIQKRIRSGKLGFTRQLMDEVAYESGSTMMSSAFFGQIIILIVFAPILFLTGVEGKMFQPMAYTFGFAMIGAIVLCLTYVPMMSALLMKPVQNRKNWFGRFERSLEKISDKIIGGIHFAYLPVLKGALRFKVLVIIAAVLLLGLAGFTFSRMGGEFVPQLDEGDIAMQALIRPGSSLAESKAASIKIEKLLLESFPEIKTVTARIGVADIPTDPMPMDIADMYLILEKDKDHWVSAETKDELIEQIKDKLEQSLVGVNLVFTQPVELRFNELLEGVREDIAVKLYGEDLDILASKVQEMADIISTVPGAGDVNAERTSGLPQMTVRYNRNKVAQYGLDIEKLNEYVSTAFAGGVAGIVFEGEKRFDLVIRFDESHRKSIDDLRTLYIDLADGTQVPIKEVADISYQPGPMQISRDNTYRRTYVGVNARGRDVESVVNDIQEKLDAELDLPAGYYITYGGEFENLERAKGRLSIVVPIALFLIFVLLYFALKSFSQSMMIYIAIPLAAIGGVFALWLRDMPFSISAGVGFIVLFGVAVLNGLVLINRFNSLKEEGVSSIRERILTGTKERIRPIMLTATTDIFGFLPMAFSSSAGAEVQRPLATVVIGGMLTATILTLVILPILYSFIEASVSKKSGNKGSLKVPAMAVILCLFLFGSSLPVSAQNVPGKAVTTLEEALAIGLNNNGTVQVAKTNVELQRLGKKSSFNPGKTAIGVQYGQYNSFERDLSLNIGQSFEFPSVYANQRKLAGQRIIGGERQLAATENKLKREIRKTWHELAYLKEKEKLLVYQDSVYGRFLKAATVRYETEETNYLEKANAETGVMEIQNELKLLWADMLILQRELGVLVNDTTVLVFAPDALKEKQFDNLLNPDQLTTNPLLALSRQEVKIANAEAAVLSSKALPEFFIGYFNQSLIGSSTSDGGIARSSDRFGGLNAGISVPLFDRSFKSNTQAARLKSEMAQTRSDYFYTSLQGQYNQQLQEILKFQSSLNYYKEKALPQADLIIENAQKSFENGAISYVEYFQSLNTAISIKFNYLNTINGYNQAIIDLEYLMGQ